jgi:hypothetical protein
MCPMLMAPSVSNPVRSRQFRDLVLRRHLERHKGVFGLPTACTCSCVRRVASELVVFETSDALAEKAKQWQERTLSEGSRYVIYRRYFTAEDLVEQIGGGRVHFDGDHFVVVASQYADLERL